MQGAFDEARRQAPCVIFLDGVDTLTPLACAPVTRPGDRRRPRFDRVAYRACNAVERLLNRFTQYRVIVTRYDKLRSMYRAVLTFAAMRLWL